MDPSWSAVREASSASSRSPGPLAKASWPASRVVRRPGSAEAQTEAGASPRRTPRASWSRCTASASAWGASAARVRDGQLCDRGMNVDSGDVDPVPTCGLGPGAPACAAGEVCVQSWSLEGTCQPPQPPQLPRKLCDPFDPEAWCGDADCVQPGSGWGLSSAGHLIGECSGAQSEADDDPRPLCILGGCPSSGVGSCAEGERCRGDAQLGLPALGHCSSECDFWGDPDGSCPADMDCVICSGGDEPIVGCCEPQAPSTSPPADAPCAAPETLGPLGECVPMCDSRALPGEPGACGQGELCWPLGGPGLGCCAPSCDPRSADGDAACGAGRWCRPLPPADGCAGSVGECVVAGSILEGGQCATALVERPCEPGNLCVELPSSCQSFSCARSSGTPRAYCRAICDPNADRPACPSDATCTPWNDSGVRGVLGTCLPTPP